MTHATVAFVAFACGWASWPLGLALLLGRVHVGAWLESRQLRVPYPTWKWALRAWRRAWLRWRYGIGRRC